MNDKHSRRTSSMPGGRAILGRRSFLRYSGLGAIAVGAAPVLAGLGGAASAATPAAAGVNLLPASIADTSFGTTGFVIKAVSGTDPTLANDTATAGFGGHSIRATATTAARIKALTAVGQPVHAGQQYTVLGSLRMPRASTASMQVTWLKADGTYLSYASSTSTAVTANVVKPLTFTATAPATAALAQVQINVDTAPAVGDVLNFGLFDLAAGSVTTWSAGTGTAIQPSGTGFLRLQDADPTGSVSAAGYWQFTSIADLQAALNLCTGGQVLSLPPNCTVGISGFSHGNHDGVRIGSGGATGCGGVQGTDLTSVVEILAGSATPAQVALGQMTTGTNPLFVIDVAGTSSAQLVGTVLKNFTLHGTLQGTTASPASYNGIYFQYSTNAVAYGLLLAGASPGTANVPPGETFGIDFNRSPDCLVSHTEIDGRNDSGTPTCASPIGWNNTTNSVGYVLLDTVYLHHAKASGLTFFKTDNIVTNNVRCEHNGTGHGTLNGIGINHEESNGRIRHNNVTLIVGYSSASTGNSAQHISLQNVLADMTDVQLTVLSFDQSEPAGGGAFSVMTGDGYTFGSGTSQQVTTQPTITLVGASAPLTAYDTHTGTSACTPSTGFVRYH